MSVECNKELIRHWFEDIVNGRTPTSVFLKALEDVFTPDFVDHDGPDPASLVQWSAVRAQ